MPTGNDSLSAAGTPAGQGHCPRWSSGTATRRGTGTNCSMTGVPTCGVFHVTVVVKRVVLGRPGVRWPAGILTGGDQVLTAQSETDRPPVDLFAGSPGIDLEAAECAAAAL